MQYDRTFVFLYGIITLVRWYHHHMKIYQNKLAWKYTPTGQIHRNVSVTEPFGTFTEKFIWPTLTYNLSSWMMIIPKTEHFWKFNLYWIQNIRKLHQIFKKHMRLKITNFKMVASHFLYFWRPMRYGSIKKERNRSYDIHFTCALINICYL